MTRRGCRQRCGAALADSGKSSGGAWSCHVDLVEDAAGLYQFEFKRPNP
jgi:hypothetical protein